MIQRKLLFRWRTTDEFGKHNSHTVSSDSYVVDAYRAVAEPGARTSLAPSGDVDEALIDPVGAGGGFIGSGLVTTQMGRSLPAIVELSFEIDFLVFEDGETAGPDSDQ